MENASHWKHLFRSIARYFGYWIETFMLVARLNFEFLNLFFLNLSFGVMSEIEEEM